MSKTDAGVLPATSLPSSSLLQAFVQRLWPCQGYACSFPNPRHRKAAVNRPVCLVARRMPLAPASHRVGSVLAPHVGCIAVGRGKYLSCWTRSSMRCGSPWHLHRPFARHGCEIRLPVAAAMDWGRLEVGSLGSCTWMCLAAVWTAVARRHRPRQPACKPGSVSSAVCCVKDWATLSFVKSGSFRFLAECRATSASNEHGQDSFRGFQCVRFLGAAVFLRESMSTWQLVNDGV